jgi:hypothetical protein
MIKDLCLEYAAAGLQPDRILAVLDRKIQELKYTPNPSQVVTLENRNERTDHREGSKEE